MQIRRRHVLAAIAIAASLGFAAGWLVQAARQPTLEERAKEKAVDLRHRTEELLSPSRR
ncbi:MAG TPA: DUF1049 domain-containing protein [Anaeromyxobacteraceae bacterium]|nr:DUF1049 domain-containing protein [Anaeromyxobacteraceae bacterium]